LYIGTIACGDESAAPSAAKARATSSIVTQGELWMGQRITIAIELATPGIFSSAPTFDLPKVSGVFLMAPEDRPVVGSEAVGDETFTTQRHELTVFSEHEGTVDIPAITVRFDSSSRFGQPTIAQRVTTPALSLTVRRPPGTEQFGTVVTSTKMTAKESWSPPLADGPVKLGSAFTRTIRLEAADVPGMLLQTTAADKTSTLFAYPKSPRLEDTRDRGQLTGRRIDQTTFVCEQPGTGTLPGLSFAWWNPESLQIERATLPSHAIEVAAATDAETVTAPMPARRTRISLLPVACFLLLAICGWIFKDKFAQAIKRHQARVATTEPTFFAHFVEACAEHNAAAVEQRLLDWLDRFYPNQCDSVMQAFLHDAHARTLTAAIAEWESRLYGRHGPPPDRRLIHDMLVLIRTSRHRILSIRRTRNSASAVLPALNPTHD